MKSKQLSFQTLSLPYIIWSIGFIIIPLVMIIYYGFVDKAGHFTFENLLAITTKEYAKALFLSLGLSLVSTLICLLIAYPLAMILSKISFGNAFIVLIFILPMWMNSLLRTLAWQTLLERTGVINTLLALFSSYQLHIINTPYSIILGMVYNFLPFMILPIYNSLIKIDPLIIDGAYDLGAKKTQVFIKIILPLTKTGIVSGIVMVFVPALTTFIISDLLGGSKFLLIGNVIEQQFKQINNWHRGSGLSLVLMLFIALSMIMMSMTNQEKKGGVYQ